MTSTLSLLALFLFAASTPSNQALAQTDTTSTVYYNTYGYDDWDLNDNAEILEDEFGSGVYDTWDADHSGFIDENEYNTWTNTWSF